MALPTVNLLGRSRPKGTSVVVRSERHRRKLIRVIEEALVDLETTDARVIEIQPLVQVVGPAGYPAWREAWAKSWNKKQTGYSTASWPPRIGDAELAALLVPVSAGRVGNALGKFPRPAAEPTIVVGSSATANVDDAALAVCAQWFRHLAPRGTIAAPPVVETIVGGQPQERRVVDFKIAWTLPAPDGV